MKTRLYHLLAQLLKNILWTLSWIVRATFVAIISGSASAIFLISLDAITNWREAHIWIIVLLPICGAAVGFLYHRYEPMGVAKGNNLIIENIHAPENKPITWLMSPLVLLGTWLTHLGGGSAGREGTAVQMGGSLADQLSRFFHFSESDRRILLMCGVAAGFSSVFGTPLTAAVFALEMAKPSQWNYKAWGPVIYTSFGANYVCDLWPVHHTHYDVMAMPMLSPTLFAYTLIAAVVFGMAARVFVEVQEFVAHQAKKQIANPVLRPALGGAVVATIVWCLGTTNYIGLGIPTIQAAFLEAAPLHVFAIKILLTGITLGSGMRGGEVTPLFFTGATLGSALSSCLSLPLSCLAGMGFISVFAAAANTPLTGFVLGIEMFGSDGAAYWFIASVIAWGVSGAKGIYAAQQIGES